MYLHDLIEIHITYEQRIQQKVYIPHESITLLSQNLQSGFTRLPEYTLNSCNSLRFEDMVKY